MARHVKKAGIFNMRSGKYETQYGASFQKMVKKIVSASMKSAHLFLLWHDQEEETSDWHLACDSCMKTG